MQALTLGMWWIATLIVAIWLVWRARPQHPTRRYRTHVFIKHVEDLSPDDVLRTAPYEVTLLIPSLDNHGGAKTVYHQLTVTPPDLPVGHAREAQRNKSYLDAWAAIGDPSDLVFHRPGLWRIELLAQAGLVLFAQFVMAGAGFLNWKLVMTSSPSLVFVFAPTMAVIAYVFALALWRAGREALGLIRLSAKPVTVPARITGVRQVVGMRPGHATAFEVSLMWAPLDMPVQFGVIRLSSTRRSTRILLHKLLETQLQEEVAGKLRVRGEPPAPPQARAAVTVLNTPQGPTTVKITALPPTDRRHDPRPEKVRKAAKRAREKREAQLLAQREAHEKSTAQARIEAASPAQQGGWDEALQEVVQAGPRAWYYPLNPGRVHLVGFSGSRADLLQMWGRLLMWAGIALLMGLAFAQWAVLYPEVMFPNHQVPPDTQMPLGRWE